MTILKIKQTAGIDAFEVEGEERLALEKFAEWRGWLEQKEKDADAKLERLQKQISEMTGQGGVGGPKVPSRFN